MIRYQFYNIIVFIIINAAFGNSVSLDFHTALGECSIEGLSSKHSSIVKNLTIKYSEQVNQTFYPIQHQPYHIYFSKDLQDFHKQSGSSTPDWAFAVTKKNPNRIIIQHTNNTNTLRKILVHELNHIYLNNVSHSYTIPSWFKEGMAVNESGEFSINHMILFSTAKWQKGLFSIDELTNFKTVSKDNSKLAYAQSYLMFNALGYYYGSDIYRNIIIQMDKGNNFWDTLRYLTNDNKANIQYKIQEFLNKKYIWMFLFNKNKYNLIFIFLPIILILGYLYKRYKNKKLLRQWELEELLEDLQENEKPN